MGKPTGFIEFARELPQDRDPLERVADWDEFHEHFPDERLRDQGARCMDCGIPFCHLGDIVSQGRQRLWLPDQQPNPRMERLGLSRIVAGGAREAAQDQQLPGVYRPGLPGTLRGGLRAGDQRPAGDDQERRVRHCR